MKNAKNIAIIGVGESGVGAALLAQKEGYSFLLSDGGPIKPEAKKILDQHQIPYEENGHSERSIMSAELIVKSPGIPNEAPLIRQALERDIPVISEIEFAYQHCNATLVAVTGTNGKTTVASLVYDMMQKGGLDSALAGNIGSSFARSVALDPKPFYALEVSSFQLDNIRDFRPHIAILTNITPDHLDRYNQNIDEYGASKMRITENQTEEDHFIWCSDDELSQKYFKAHGTRANVYEMSQTRAVEQGAQINEQDEIEIKIKNEEVMNINELALQGKHNRYNNMAAAIQGRLLHIRKEKVRECLAGFESIEHRLEPVLEIYGMQFINDSKATNVNSTRYALESMRSPTIWLAGGTDKGNDYSSLYKFVEGKVKAIVCIGEDNRKLHACFSDKVEFMIDAADMDEAVRIAYKLGNKGDNVLLSPACASFDRFDNYEERGRQFKQAVRSL